MSIKVMKLALEALENASPAAWASRVDSDTMKSIWRKHADAMEGLRVLLADLDNASCKSAQKRLEAQQPSSKEHLFELWWEAHMPNATQEQAWTAFTAAVASNGVGIAAQQPDTGEPVYWEWRHLSTHPDTVDFGQWSKWQRVEARSAIHTIEDALAEFRTYIAQGCKYELRALYDHPAPSVPADVVRDAERLNDLESLVKSKGTHGLSFDYCRHVEDGYVVEKGFRLIWRHTLCERKPTLREAIDAAMLAAK